MGEPKSSIEQNFNVSFNFEGSPIDAGWKERILEKLSSIPEVFTQSNLDVGRNGQGKQQIKLSDDTTFKHKVRPIHLIYVKNVRKHLQELHHTGVICESSSPVSSSIIVVRKKNGEVRLCIDYRNLKTVKDSYALPNLEENFSTLTGSQWFSVLDLKLGYFEIEVEESDKAKTAFFFPISFGEFNRMPQGIMPQVRFSVR